MPKKPEDFSTETSKIIIQTARRLFLELGFRAVSTRRIADACGLTQPALYHHFANKQELYLAVHHEMLTETRQGLERIARRGEGLNESLSAVVRYLLATQAEDTSLLFHDLEHELDAEVRDNIRNLFRENVVAPIASIVVRAVEEGTLQSVEKGGLAPAVVAYLLLSMIQGMAHMPLTPDTAVYNADKTADMISEIMLNGLPRQ